MALNVKQKYPGTQGGAAQLYASDTRLSLRRREQVFTRLSKSYKENMDISSIFLFLPGSVDATWRISSSSLRMCARQDCFVFERPQVVFYCNFSCSRHVSKSTNLIGRIVFDAAHQTKKMVKMVKMTLLRVAFFASVCTLTLAPFVKSRGVKRRRISRVKFIPVCTGL